MGTSRQRGSSILYTDDSRDPIGNVGAGWALYENDNQKLNLIEIGSCYLGNIMEVYDAEIHAVYEGLKYVQSSTLLPSQVLICIDSTSEISVLKYNLGKVYNRQTTN
jgi:ribonuclease HI